MPKHAEPAATPPIALNKRARYEYFIEETYDAGLSLQGWEVKSFRAGRAQISEAYVLVKDGEAWLFGAHVAPLPTTSTHVVADPTRTRKLLLNRSELNRLIGAVEPSGSPDPAQAALNGRRSQPGSPGRRRTHATEKGPRSTREVAAARVRALSPRAIFHLSARA
jgi:hypothetical protein